MKKHILMSWVFCLLLQMVACGNNGNKKSLHNRLAKDSIAQDKIIDPEIPQILIEEDTSRYKIEYVKFMDFKKSNPDLFKRYTEGFIEGIDYNSVCLINFIEKTTGKVINTYDVVENNPYKNLDYEILGKNDWGGYIYAIDEIKAQHKSLLTMSKPTHLKKNRTQKPWKIRTFAQVDYYDKHNATIIYRISLYNVDNECIAEKTYFKIFNNQGVQIMDYPDVEIECGSAAVTEDGKFLAVDYFNYYYEFGLGVIDVKTKKRIFFKDGNNQRTPETEGNFVVEREGLNGGIKYSFYDFVNNLCYTKIIGNDYSALLSISGSKITLKEAKTGKVVDFMIKKDFNTSKIFEK